MQITRILASQNTRPATYRRTLRSAAAFKLGELAITKVKSPHSSMENPKYIPTWHIRLEGPSTGQSAGFLHIPFSIPHPTKRQQLRDKVIWIHCQNHDFRFIVGEGEELSLAHPGFDRPRPITEPSAELTAQAQEIANQAINQLLSHTPTEQDVQAIRKIQGT